MLKVNLEHAQFRMKQQAYKHKSERSFDEGDTVYLRLVLYQHKSLASHSFHKLQPRFYGPFEILAKVGHVAYKLKLPDNSKVHPVFHVSCLKKQLGVGVIHTVPLPIVTDAGLVQEQPLAILQKRMVQRGPIAATEVLVHWKNHSPDETTWEDYSDLQTRFPDFHEYQP